MGATPKDGPSAGVSLFASLMSSVLNRPVAPNLAMTGEISTYGEVIAIGGVREKLTACKNHNVSRVILPLSNKKHIKQLPDEFKTGFTIYYIRDVKQLFEICFPESPKLEDHKSTAFAKRMIELGVEIDQFETDHF